MKISGVVVVTRHPALVEYLIESEVINEETPVITGNANISDIEGRHVIGILPLRLAAYAASITEVSLDIPFDQRGKELTIDQIREYEYENGEETYTVERIDTSTLRWELSNDNYWGSLSDLPTWALLKLRELIKGVK
jgi:putative CRISPR-associated protein (TIGR02620 family)